MRTPILYLDYDGVLHPADVRVTASEPQQPRVYSGGQPTDHALFEHVALLERILAPFPDVRISLATSWVRTLGFEFAVQQLTPSLRARVVGTIWRGALLRFPPRTRHDAITTDVEERNVQRWLALDDDVDGWPEERRHLVIAPNNAWEGLSQPRLADELSDALALLCSGQPLESRRPKSALIPSTVERLFGGS